MSEGRLGSSKRSEGLAHRPDSPGLFLALAPMDGITDAVYRDVLTAIDGGCSGISACVSEFVRVTRDPVPAHVLLRDCPELHALRGTRGRTAAGVPVYVQLLGGAPEPMAATAATAAELGALGIDLNFGCPAKTVNNHDGGASLLKAPQRIERVVAAVRKAVPANLPVSAKIRLGWDCARGVEDLARAAEAGGATWLTIHARTRTQLYRPPVDWGAIGRARVAVTMPVVANGDLFEASDIEACRQESGCDAFMIGRGAMARPRLFRQIRGDDVPDFDPLWFEGLLREYVDALALGGATERAVLGRLKQWLRMAAPHYAVMAAMFDAVKREQTLDGARSILASLRKAAA